MSPSFTKMRPRTFLDEKFFSAHSTSEELSEYELFQQALYRKEIASSQKTESSWLDSVSILPFDCTSCGKCCRTIGNVFMSPEELLAAAEFMNMTADRFIQVYAERKIVDPSSAKKENVLPWILLRNEEREQSPACVFLDEESNQCTIYPVRPVQCSTYPFWSNIMESKMRWNEEVRRRDEDSDYNDSEPSSSHSLPYWSPSGGGCEGMQVLDKENMSSRSIGVPLDQAMEQLSLYQRADRRLPRTGVSEFIKNQTSSVLK
uniref:Zinc/iron-chelating domain-containing protein n=1 Tax=Corethron hystrix TaxID=216773 RepID=A0A7S1FR63_9STRA|mmetsp:Transcript_22335/g.51170  ORF Transcript_22335/g.51170 Transcript_22335/m.51170 type:complete len:261 (+) Transcript_22335:189-971(+)